MSEPEPALDTPFAGIDVNKWLIDRARSAIKKKLGADYDPDKLIRLLGAVCKAENLPDSDVLDLAEMFIFLMDHNLKWPLGSQIFRHYLNEGGLYPPVLFLPSSHLLSSPDFRSGVCSTQWTIIERAIADRVRDTTGALFPRDRTTGEPKPSVVTDDLGTQITVTPAPSPLRPGGTETIYAETSVRAISEEKTELAATFNKVGVVSKVTVTSTPASETSWTIEIVEWTTWAWERADFNPSALPDIQTFPINVGTFFGAPWIEKQVIAILEKQYAISAQCLDNLIGFDKYMLQLANKQFHRVNIVTGQTVDYFPKPFDVYFSHWDFFAETNQCGAPRTYTITDFSGMPP